MHPKASASQYLQRPKYDQTELQAMSGNNFQVRNQTLKKCFSASAHHIRYADFHSFDLKTCQIHLHATSPVLYSPGPFSCSVLLTWPKFPL